MDRKESYRLAHPLSRVARYLHTQSRTPKIKKEDKTLQNCAKEDKKDAS